MPEVLCRSIGSPAGVFVWPISNDELSDLLQNRQILSLSSPLAATVYIQARPDFHPDVLSRWVIMSRLSRDHRLAVCIRERRPVDLALSGCSEPVHVLLDANCTDQSQQRTTPEHWLRAIACLCRNCDTVTQFASECLANLDEMRESCRPLSDALEDAGWPHTASAVRAAVWGYLRHAVAIATGFSMPSVHNAA